MFWLYTILNKCANYPCQFKNQCDEQTYSFGSTNNGRCNEHCQFFGENSNAQRHFIINAEAIVSEVQIQAEPVGTNKREREGKKEKQQQFKHSTGDMKIYLITYSFRMHLVFRYACLTSVCAIVRNRQPQYKNANQNIKKNSSVNWVCVEWLWLYIHHPIAMGENSYFTYISFSLYLFQFQLTYSHSEHKTYVCTFSYNILVIKFEFGSVALQKNEKKNKFIKSKLMIYTRVVG